MKCFVSLFVAFCISSVLAQDNVIMVINGVNIKKSEIKISKKVLETYKIRSKSDKLPDSLVKKLEKSRLEVLIRNIILDAAMKKYNIEVTDKDIRQAIDKYYWQGKDSKAQLAKEQKIWRTLGRCLRKVLAKNADSKKIYEKEIKQLGYSYQTWGKMVEQFNTERKISILEKSIPKNEEDVFKSCVDTFKPMLKEEKLRCKILGKEKSKGKYGFQQYWQWKAQQYATLKIKLCDEKYKYLYDYALKIKEKNRLITR